MIDLQNSVNKELSKKVTQDNYFMAEIDNMPLLLALVGEEFHYTPVQLEILKSDLDFLFIQSLNNCYNVVSIREQFDELLGTGKFPCLEYEIASGDFLLVNIALDVKGFLFSFDSDSKPVYFDGDIEVIDDNHYLLPFDKDESNIDGYLEMISDNIVDGYLMANDLLAGGNDE